MKTKGLTLAELMLSLGIASVSVLMIFEMVTAGLGHYRKLEVIGTTQALAEGKMEEMVARDVYALAPSSGDFAPPHEEYHYDVTVSDHGPAAVKDVKVEVTHKGGTRRTLATVRAPNITPKGMALFFKYNCDSCHSVAGLNEIGTAMAPDLTTVSTKGQTYIRDSITDPDANFALITDPAYKWDKDGDGTPESSWMSSMDYTIPADQIDDLTTWLYNLTP